MIAEGVGRARIDDVPHDEMPEWCEDYLSAAQSHTSNRLRWRNLLLAAPRGGLPSTVALVGHVLEAHHPQVQIGCHQRGARPLRSRAPAGRTAVTAKREDYSDCARWHGQFQPMPDQRHPDHPDPISESRTASILTTDGRSSGTLTGHWTTNAGVE